MSLIHQSVKYVLLVLLVASQCIGSYIRNDVLVRGNVVTLKKRGQSLTSDLRLFEDLPPICESQIYCQGELLKDVQLARIFEDSKTFVDKKLKFPERDILQRYKELKATAGNRSLTKTELEKFVEDNFEEAEELESWLPPDFTDRPALASLVADWKYRKWLLLLNQIWKQLGKKMNIDVLVNADRHSLIYVENGFFIPGGRFLELYYWDTYWIVRGVLLCDMPNTARGIIENIISIVQRFGYMLNGSRRYYTGRTQPPLLIQMAATYYTTTNDLGFIKNNILTFEREFQFWLNNRMVAINKDGNVYILAHYQVQTSGPRPESFKEDYELGMNLTSEAERNRLYNNLKASAESGWDFTSRYFNKNGTDGGTLADIDTPNFINVDLNAILHANAVTLAEWFHILDDPVKSMYYKNIAKRFLIGIEAVLWCEEVGMWFDYDMRNEKPRKLFYPSNFAPLWTGSYTFPKPLVAQSAIRYLIANNVITPNYAPVYYGIPTSLRNSTQQWDFPSCWPPLQAMVIQGLDRTYDIKAQLVAYNLASKWVFTNYIGYSRTGTMFEKFDAQQLGTSGGGGEYRSQTGFGWTNGVIFELFARWGNLLTSAEASIGINPWSKDSVDSIIRNKK
uniref:Trehalase n=1 Tax=Cacopsylla melanoneura TaxID=428564 RepID=A0A8D8LCN1_9HEMI